MNSALTGYYLDGDTVLIEKQNGVNVAQYLWGNGLVRCNGEYPLTDGRVNMRLSTNASQQVTSSNQPDAFGVGSVTAGTASAYAYGGAAGYREDGISPAGLSTAYAFQKVGARYYDPAFGCFLTRDTELGQKPYAYCDGDPVNCTDPSGHDSVDAKSANGHMELVSGLILAATICIAIATFPITGPVTAGVFFFAAAIVIADGLVVAGLETIDAGNKQEQQEKGDAGNLPEKAGGVPGAVGDTMSSSNQDWKPGTDGKWYRSGSPYSGAPHGGPLPPGAKIGN